MLDAGYIERMFKDILIFGPLAAMYGREIEQYLIQNYMPDLVPESDFAFSVQQGRTSVKKIPLRVLNVDDSYEEDRRARASSRRAEEGERGRDSSWY